MKLFHKKFTNISNIDITLFFRQLATLLSAGIPIAQCCDILASQLEKIKMRSLLYSLKHALESGKGLANSLRRQHKYFDDLTCHLVEAGEQTGTLDNMLHSIATHREKSLQLKNKIKQALFYPSIVFIIAMIVCVIMLTCVVPRFAELFHQVNKNLPPFTRFIIQISEWLTHYFGFFCLPLCCGLLVIHFSKHTLRYQYWKDRLILKIPGLSFLMIKNILIRFTRSLATSCRAGIPITESLKIAANTCGNFLYTKAILKLQHNIMKGHQLHQAMRKSPIFPKMMIQMIKVGEESGELEKMLERIAFIYEDELDHIITSLSHLFEPLIITVLGVLIGGIVVALYLPIFKLGTVWTS